MSKASELYKNINRYTETVYEIYDPEAEVTDEQLRLFFERCEELHSPVDLDVSILEWRDRGEIFLTDDEVVGLTSLSSVDFYNIFGSRVYLDADEPLTRPERQVRLSVYTLAESELGGVLLVSQSQQYEVTYHNDIDVRVPYYREKEEILDKALLKSLSQVVTKFASELLLETPSNRQEIDESCDDLDIIHRLKEHRAFTQGRWLRAMMLLDMIKILKELGLTTTDELNW